MAADLDQALRAVAGVIGVLEHGDEADDEQPEVLRQLVVARARAMHPAGTGVDGGGSSPPSTPQAATRR